jgi:hypothetical protein
VGALNQTDQKRTAVRGRQDQRRRRLRRVGDVGEEKQELQWTEEEEVREERGFFLVENKAAWWEGRWPAGRDRKERIEGEASQGQAARHLASLPPSPSSSPFVKNQIPSPLPVDGWRTGGECRNGEEEYLDFPMGACVVALCNGKESEMGMGRAQIPCVNGNVCPRVWDWFFYALHFTAGNWKSIGHGCGGMREEYASLAWNSFLERRGGGSAMKAAGAGAAAPTRRRRTCKCAAFSRWE